MKRCVLLAAMVAAVGGAGCLPGYGALRERAAIDLACPVDDIALATDRRGPPGWPRRHAITPLPNSGVIAENDAVGCSQRAHYALICHDPLWGDCAWRLQASR